MDNGGKARVAAFLAQEYRAAEESVRRSEFIAAWHHLERAHILAQMELGPHCRSHWRMLRLALRTRDWREALGQLVRLALAPVGNLSGRLPVGNTGRADVSAFAPMTIPPDLQAILSRDTD